MTDHEEQHIDIRDKLKNLPRAKAREDFTAKLLQKINLIDAETAREEFKKTEAPVKESVLSRLFGGSRKVWLAPAMGLVVVAVIAVIFIFRENRNDATIMQDMTTSQSVQKQDNSGITREDSKKPGNEVNSDLADATQKKEISSTPSIERHSSDRGAMKDETVRKSAPVEFKTNQPGLKTEEKQVGIPPEKEVKSDVKIKTDDLLKEDIKPSETIKPVKPDKKELRTMPPTTKGKEGIMDQKDKIKTDTNKKEEPSRKTGKGINDIDKSSLEKLKEKIIDK